MFIHVPHPTVEQVIAQTEKSGRRYYTTPTGNRYPSVTTVVGLHSKDGIQKWRKRVGEEEANRVSRRAGGRGNRIHSLIEQTLRNEIVKPNLFDVEMYRSMLRYVNRINNIRLLESALYSDELRLAGRCDCVAEFDGELAIIDFKSSLRRKKVEYVEGYCMQVSAYAVMYEELFGTPVHIGRIIIGVDDDKAQLFKVTTKDWIPDLLRYRNEWESKYGRAA